MSDREWMPGEIQAFPAFPDPEPDPRDAEIAGLRQRYETEKQLRVLASIARDEAAAENARLRAENTVLRADLDRLLALADVIRRNQARDAELAP